MRCHTVFVCDRSECLRSAHDFLEIFQTVQSFVEGVVLLGEMDADDVTHILFEEGRAGNTGHTYLGGHFLTELYVGLTGLHVGADVGQHEISALRIGVGDADAVQTLGKQLLHVSVVIAKLLIITWSVRKRSVLEQDIGK